MSIIQIPGNVQAYRPDQGRKGKNRFSKRPLFLSIIVITSIVFITFNSSARIDLVQEEDLPAESVELVDLGTRIVTGYTLGNPAETDDTPCIGAYGHDLCEMVKNGEMICASNEFPMGTKILLGENRECVVLDRTNARYKYRVDIAFITRAQAVDFGKRILPVSKVIQ